MKEAIRGLTCLFYGKGGQLVPMKEMVDAITVKSAAKGSNIGASCQHQAFLFPHIRPTEVYVCSWSRIVGSTTLVPF